MILKLKSDDKKPENQPEAQAAPAPADDKTPLPAAPDGGQEADATADADADAPLLPETRSLLSRLNPLPLALQAGHFLLAHIKWIIAAVLIVIAGAVGYDLLLKSQLEARYDKVVTAYAEGDYPLIIELLSKVSLSGETGLSTEEVLLLAQAYIYQQQYDGANAVLENYKKTSAAGPDLDYSVAARLESYLMLVDIFTENFFAAGQHLQAIILLNTNVDYLPSYYLRALAAIRQDDLEGADAALSEGIEAAKTGGDDAAIGREIQFFRQVFYRASDSQLYDVTRVSPYGKDIDKVLPGGGAVADYITLSQEGFVSLFYVPTDGAALIEESLNGHGNMQMLRVLVNLKQEEWDLAGAYLQELQGHESASSLHYFYFSAYLAVAKGDYRGAADHYRVLQEKDAGVDPSLMLGAVLHGEDAPVEEIISVYTDILSQYPDNPFIIGNLGYLYLYIDDIKKAGEMLDRGYQMAPENFSVAYNYAILEILRENLEKALEVLNLMRAQTSQFPVPILRALAQVNLLYGDVNEAVAYLTTLKKFAPSPGIYRQTADVYRDSNQQLLALSELVSGRVAFPDDIDIQLDLLLEYAKQQDVNQYKTMRSVIAPDLLEQDYRAQLAEALVSGYEKNSEQKERHFTQALLLSKTQKTKTEILLYWLRALMDADNYIGVLEVIKTAETLYEEQEQLLPSSFETIRIWGEAHISNDERKSEMLVELLLQESLAMSPEEQTDLANALIVLGDSKQAVALLEPLTSVYAISRLLKTLEKGYLELGEEGKAAFIRKKLERVSSEQEEEKQKAITAAIESIKDSGLAFSASGTSGLQSVGDDVEAVVASGKGGAAIERLNEAVRDKDYIAAIAIYNDLLTEKENRLEPSLMHQNRGVLYLKIEQYQKAVEDFERALQLGGLNEQDKISVIYNNSLALLKLGQYEKARSALGEMLALDPNNMRGLLLYAQLLEKLRLYPELQAVYHKVIELEPNQIAAYLQLAHVHRLANEMEEAIAVLEQGMIIAPKNKPLHRTLADLYALTGNNRKAQEHLTISENL